MIEQRRTPRQDKEGKEGQRLKSPAPIRNSERRTTETLVVGGSQRVDGPRVADVIKVSVRCSFLSNTGFTMKYG